MRRIAVVVSIVVSLVPLHARSGDAGCAREFVPAVGNVCREGSLLRVFLPDGSSRLTHGGDPVPTDGPTLDATPVAPVCVADPLQDLAGLAVYAVSAGSPDRYDTMADQIRSMIGQANGLMREEAAAFNRRLDYRMVCDGDGRISVAKVIVPTPVTATTFETILAATYASGHALTTRKYWIWYDGRPPGAPGGLGTFESDDRARPDNRNNLGPSYAVTFGYTGASGVRVLMHENGHNMGAVQFSAPSTTGAGHCWDGIDIMCYNDGGPRGSWYRVVCPVSRFDCGSNDYFHPTPAPGSYLATAWNLASPHNQFVQGCVYATGALTAVGASPSPAATAEIAIPAACIGRPYAANARIRTLPASALTTTTGPTRRSVDIDVCWFGGTEPLGCDANDVAEWGTVPAGATHATVTLATGANATYVLSAV